MIDCKGLSYGHLRNDVIVYLTTSITNRANLLEVFKLKARLSNMSLETFFDCSVNSRTRGRPFVQDLKEQLSKLDIRKYFFAERVTNRWNNLSPDQTSLSGFKRILESRQKAEVGFFMDSLFLW